MLHLYKNDVVEWFAAESVEDAKKVALAYLIETCGIGEEECDLNFEQVPDGKVLKCHIEDNEPSEPDFIEKTALEWATDNGRGLVMSTEW